MKYLSTIFGIALLFSSGCFINDSRDDFNVVVDPTFPGAGQVDMTWDLTGGELDQSVGCPPNARTMQVTMVPEGRDCDDFDCYITCFNCTDGGGRTPDYIAPNDYDIFFSLSEAGLETACEDAGNVGLIAQSDVFPILVNGLASIDVSFPVDGGFFESEYDIFDVNGAPLTCAQAGAAGFSYTSTLVSDSSVVALSDHACQDGINAIQRSDKVTFGDWTVSRQLLNGVGAALATDNTNGSISFGNELVTLTPAQLQLQ